jgi:hypothetical protein
MHRLATAVAESDSAARIEKVQILSYIISVKQVMEVIFIILFLAGFRPVYELYKFGSLSFQSALG